MSIGNCAVAKLKILIAVGITSMPLGVILVFLTFPLTPKLNLFCSRSDFSKTSGAILFLGIVNCIVPLAVLQYNEADST